MNLNEFPRIDCGDVDRVVVVVVDVLNMCEFLQQLEDIGVVCE